MRSAVRIDDDLMMELKERARRENVSQTRTLNRLVREGIKASRARRPKKAQYKEKTVAIGTPRIDLDKALAISHGPVLVSCDGDFARFRGLRWEYPTDSH